MNIILGSNTAKDCEAVLVIVDKEMVRVRESAEGALLCDFDVSDESGKRLAKIVKNQVVYAAQGFSFRSQSNGGEVVSPTGEVIASALREGDAIRLTGQFFNEGRFVRATATDLHVGGTRYRGSLTVGGRAFVVDADSSSLGG